MVPPYINTLNILSICPNDKHYTIINLLPDWKPNCSHAIPDSLEPHEDLHTVPHFLCIHISNRPSLGSTPPTKRMSPGLQISPINVKHEEQKCLKFDSVLTIQRK